MTAMMTRKQLRELGTRLNIAAHGRHDDALIDLRAADVAMAANALTTPLWLSANELRLVADAMDLLGMSQADAWPLRQRLDEFFRTSPMLRNAGSFAAYLQHLPNGGQE